MLVGEVYNLRINYLNGDYNSLVIDRAEGLRAEEIIGVQAEMLSANSLLGHVPLVLEEFNLNIKFYYDVRGYKLLNNYLMTEQYGGDLMRGVYLEIINVIRNSSKYLLDVNKYIMKLPLIYIDIDKNKPHLIYLPLKELNKEASMANEFKQLFIDIFKESHGVELNFYNNVIDYFDSCEFTIEELYRRVDSKNHGESSVDGKETIVTSDKAENNRVSDNEKRNRIFNWPRISFSKGRHETISSYVGKDLLINVSEDEDKEEKLAETRHLLKAVPLFYLEKDHDGQTERIDLDQPNFIIGRNKNIVNHYEDSNVISRVHLEIIRDINGYLIKDLDSKNGSFLNGVELDANKLYPIGEGDRIKLATTEYRVRTLIS